jgi:hypothetical protein
VVQPPGAEKDGGNHGEGLLLCQPPSPTLASASARSEELSGDIRLAQAQLGHARITTTELYVQRNRGAKEKAAKVIESLAAEVEKGPHGDDAATWSAVEVPLRG